MVQINNVIDDIDKLIGAEEFYSYSLKPLSIIKVENCIYYLEILCDIITKERNKIVFLIIPLLCDNSKELELNSFYEENILKDQSLKSVYEKLSNGISMDNIYQTDLNMSRLDNGFFCFGARTPKDKYVKFVINKNMFIQISLFIQNMLKNNDAAVNIFTDNIYNYIKFIDNKDIDINRAKFIVNDNMVYIVYPKLDSIYCKEMTVEDFEKVYSKNKL